MISTLTRRSFTHPAAAIDFILMDDPFPPIPPRLFDSVEEDGPFHRCLRCRADFIETGRPYFISKEFARGDCVLEYAICDQCRDEMSVELSEDSRENVQKLLEEEVDWDARFERIYGAGDISAWLGNCLFCNDLPDDNRGYGISGLFLNGRPLPGPFPAMICGNCAERMQSVLSKKTRDFWDRFSKEHFPGPPADLVDIPSPHMPAIF